MPKTAYSPSAKTVILPSGMNDEDAVGRVLAGALHVHRIFGQKDAAIGRGEDDRRMMNRRVLGEDLELPVRGELRGLDEFFIVRRGKGGTPEGNPCSQ